MKPQIEEEATARGEFLDCHIMSRAMGSFCFTNSRCFVRQIIPRLPYMLRRQYSLNISAELLRTQGFINGRWVSASSTFPVLDPATGKELAQVSDCGPQQAQEAVRSAYEAFNSWKTRTAKVNKLNRFSLVHVGLADISFSLPVVTHLSDLCGGFPNSDPVLRDTCAKL